MPYNYEAKEALKKRVPFEQRQWRKDKKLWSLSCTEENFKIAREILKENFHAEPPIFNKGGDLQATFEVAIDTTSYYTVLQIPETATHDEVKKGHRKIIFHVHPDRDGNAEHFRLVQKAYEVLYNPKKRKRYDLARGLVYRKKGNGSSAPFAVPPVPPVPPKPVTVQVINAFGRYFEGDQVTIHNQQHLGLYIFDMAILNNKASLIPVDLVYGISRVVNTAHLMPYTNHDLKVGELLRYTEGVSPSATVRFKGFRGDTLVEIQPRPFANFLGLETVPRDLVEYFTSYQHATLIPPVFNPNQGDHVSYRGQTVMFIKKIGITGDAMIDNLTKYTYGRGTNLEIVPFESLSYRIQIRN